MAITSANPQSIFGIFEAGVFQVVSLPVKEFDKMSAEEKRQWLCKNFKTQPEKILLLQP